MQNLELARERLDARFGQMRPVERFARPTRGWVRAIREALGMSSPQLAKRLGVSQPRVVALEKGEVEGTLTLKSLQKAAEALDCTLIYALVPNQPLEATVRVRAERLATERMELVERTMRLEDQAIGVSESSRQKERLIEKIIQSETRRLWERR
ncbi:mobile mystery protein A [Gloeobacter kilaueensis]|uniref:Transcriptional regulator n=1 Tax=Gloeobacter kilaueensis (strain ATCC BAA-2537 / CCAP 1431/1 / ULC 316 / JS1) TaxID=1183438 RepID=U5QM20_GLOK1|nr:mobile mystery protein A [Gloeobacter kilaueensis]AGY59913.1 transcriptional regulator [Gloeobacter kilaueensis JS1]